jgi:predicted tellurium resistance membrane protein TerC
MCATLPIRSRIAAALRISWMGAMDWITNPDLWIALVTLTALEIVLGIDNVIFIAILAGKLPVEQQTRARRLGLALALITRVMLLLSLAWIIRLTAPLVTIAGQALSGRDLILIVGGLFLLAKSTYEIHDKLEGGAGHTAGRAAVSFAGTIVQIMLLDIVFSLDSVITAVGMVDRVGVMIAAVVIAVGIMLVASGPISTFVDAHPTVKMLALSFLLLIGLGLLLEGFDQHIPKGYLYFAMGFAIFVELLNLRLRSRNRQPIALRQSYVDAEGATASTPTTDIPVSSEGA